MRTEMKMPQMGESIAEATILKWIKNVGDVVEKDETILEISTDKVDSEIPAPASGKLVQILANEGETVAVKSVIAVIDSDSSAAVEQTPAASPAPTPDAPAPQAQPQAAAPQPAPQPQQPHGEAAHASAIPTQVGDRFYSPLVRSMAAQYGVSPIELSGISGTGANGRVTKEDLELYLQHRGSSPHAGAPAPSASAQQSVGQPASSAAATSSARPQAPMPSEPRPEFGPEGVRIEPMDNMRKLIAEHMVRSKATSPHVYSMAEIDVSRVSKWRKLVQNEFLGREGFKLSFTPFFLEAAVSALKHFPRVNASVDGESIVYKRDINLGCAVALGKDGLGGLIVPVIKDAGSLNLVGIARALNDLAERARNKKLTPGDVQGGTFTVTNPGIFGNIFGCPIISQPQLAILALGAIKKRVVVVDDAIAIREMVVLTLSYDHRVIDGALAGHFLSHITKYLENWDLKRTL
ncbi:MAG: 2-oxo acid dehydrogenase subunit E2 [Bdellovibrionales bacterium]|nr:2-oxo acid dehydrogenase subunit E2 [Bdellovibrionales bacterium]